MTKKRKVENTLPMPSVSIDPSFGYLFPAIRGLQAGREYYVSMCPMRLLPKIFLFDEEELLPELRAQRTLNKNRVPEIANYILENKNDYVFSSITASIDADVRFQSFSNGENELEKADEISSRMGVLQVPMDAKFIINDGQHRRAAVEQALRENPDLGNESISVVFFVDKGLACCQQMFADLNRYTVRPSKSLGVLYDHRDDKAKLARMVVLKSKTFKNIVEMERSTLSARSRRLFTLSAIYHATNALLSNIKLESFEHASGAAVGFWDAVGEQFPEWKLVKESKITAGEVRGDYIHSHGVVLHALGNVGNFLMKRNSKDWIAKLKGLKKLDWSRKNSRVWEGRATIGGRVSKSGHNVTLTGNVIKQTLGLQLTPEEQRVEDAFLRGEYNAN